jgi:glucan biosynthesis protein C
MLWAGAGTRAGFGPFDFQVSLVLLYFGYFLMGVLIGSSGINEGIFAGRKMLFVCRH